jgi:AsnC-like helix-turn-helix protein
MSASLSKKLSDWNVHFGSWSCKNPFSLPSLARALNRRLGRPVSIFAEIALEKQARRDRFERRLATIEEIIECWEVSGDFDYLARFVCTDVPRYERLSTDLIDDPELGVARIVSHIALRAVRRSRYCAGSRSERGLRPVPNMGFFATSPSRFCRIAASIRQELSQIPP